MNSPNRRILVVDDNPAIHDDLRKILAPAGPSPILTGLEGELFGTAPTLFDACQVDSAFQGKEGIEKARAAMLCGRPYALALVDMRMPPGIDGLQTVDAIWRCDPEIQIVICTAYSDANWDDLFARFGASDRLLFLKKPFDTAEVCQLASALIEKWRLARSVQAQFAELRGQRAELARQVAFGGAVREATGEGLLVVDEARKIVDCNRRYIEIWQLEPVPNGTGAQALLSRAMDLVADPKEFRARVEYLYEHPDVACTDEVKLNDGRVLERWSGPVRSADGLYLGRVWSIKDITPRRKAEAERAMLLERLASLGRLAATVGHEINNPLAFALGNVNFLQDKFNPGPGTFGCPPEEVAEVLDTIQNGLSRIGVIVRDLQILSRPEDEVSAVDLHALIERTIQVSMNEIRHRARIVRNYGTLPLVTGNAARLGQVFLNLIVNAAQSIPEGRIDDNEITVSLIGHDDQVTIEIRDTGAGIAEEHLGRIFEPFFTTKAIGSGTGLGLSICQGIVAAHGGTIGVRSELGHGTTFTVTLPTGRPAHTPTPTTIAPKVGKPARVFIIDDDRDIRHTLKRALRGHDVLTFGKARDALALLQAGGRADVILCDLMMAEYTGMDFHADLARDLPELAACVIFMTGGAFTLQAQQYVAAVPNPCIAKPFDLVALKTMIAERTG